MEGAWEGRGREDKAEKEGERKNKRGEVQKRRERKEMSEETHARRWECRERDGRKRKCGIGNEGMERRKAPLKLRLYGAIQICLLLLLLL